MSFLNGTAVRAVLVRVSVGLLAGAIVVGCGGGGGSSPKDSAASDGLTTGTDSGGGDVAADTRGDAGTTDAPASDLGSGPDGTSVPTDSASSDAPPSDGAPSDGAADRPSDGAAGDTGPACDPAVRWPAMLAQPIVPPRLFAGLDLAGDDTWRGLTLDRAESINCASRPVNATTAAWGPSDDVEVFYETDTRLITQIFLHATYAGTLTFKDRTGAHNYLIQLGHPITKDGAPFLIDWSGANLDANLTELLNALMGPNGPGAAAQPGFTDSTNCRTDRSCLIITDDGNGISYFGVRPLGIYFNFRAGDPQPQASSPFQLYQFFQKPQPYTGAQMSFKIDAVGPSGAGTAAPLTGCSLQTGIGWDKFLSSCVQVSGNSALDALRLTQLTGGMRHDAENWTTSHLGIDPVVTHTQGPFDVIQNTTPIAGADVVTGWVMEQSPTTIRPTNELATGGANDLHGSGLLLREWARLVQNDINTLTGGHHTYGDSTCFGATPAAGCTGFESLILPGVTYTGDSASVMLLVQKTLYQISLLSFGPTALPQIVFCDDPGIYAQCTTLPVFSGALARVVRVLGHGSAASLPPALQDKRYFARWFAHALVRYLKAFGVYGAGLTPAQVAAVTDDPTAYAFGEEGTASNPFDMFRYVDRTYVTSVVPAPLAIELAFDLGTNDDGFRQLRWSSRLDRGEAALLTAMASKKTNPLGSENSVNPTNLFGSRYLRLNWQSYHCATVSDPTNCAGLPAPPIDPDTGAATLLVPYPGAWGRTLFSAGGSAMKVTATDATAGTARISLPNYADPYAAGTADPPATVDALVPWRGGARYLVPVSATADRTISGDEVHFGSTVLDLDVLYQNGAGGVVVQAIHSKKFQGAVFLCADSTTGAPVMATSYTSGRALADWVARHPADAASCGMVVRNRADGTVDSVSSTANAVKVTMSHPTAGGDPRAIDVVLWDTRF